MNNNKKGSALVLVIMVMAVLSILGTSLLFVSLAETNFATIEDKKTKAHYLGRAGIQVGLNILDKKLTTESYTTTTDIVNYLNNTYLPTIPANTFNVGSEGSFRLSYETFQINGIKIKSVGVVPGSPETTSLVTYIADIESSMSFTVNPTEWVTGINLRKSTDKNYLGSGVQLEGKPIQSPQNSADTAVFQASVIRFTDYPKDNISFQQIENSKPILFDAEIIYFESAIVLNSRDDLVQLGISDDVIDYRMTHDGVLPMYNVHAGFEDYGRYKHFIGGHLYDLHSNYTSSFEPGEHYGLVRFAGPIKETIVGNKTDDIWPEGYYFYKHGVDLRNSGTNGLIKIEDNDAVIKALEAMFTFHVSTTEFIWNEK